MSLDAILSANLTIPYTCDLPQGVVVPSGQQF
jgi:hypothetical protein